LSLQKKKSSGLWPIQSFDWDFSLLYLAKPWQEVSVRLAAIGTGVCSKH